MVNSKKQHIFSNSLPTLSKLSKALFMVSITTLVLSLVVNFGFTSSQVYGQSQDRKFEIPIDVLGNIQSGLGQQPTVIDLASRGIHHGDTIHISTQGIFGSDCSETRQPSNVMVGPIGMDSNGFRLNGQFSSSSQISGEIGSYFRIDNPNDFSTIVPAEATHLHLAIEDRNSFDNCGDVTATISATPQFTETNTPLKLQLPSLEDKEATGPTGAIVTFEVTASGSNDEPQPTPICNPPSGSMFKIGITVVSCTVTDSSGLSDSGTFDVRVVDKTKPKNVEIKAQQDLSGNTLSFGAVSTSKSVKFFLSHPTDEVTTEPITQCSLDGKIQDCKNSITYNDLSAGQHTFIFSAKDEENIEDDIFVWSIRR